jgi:hypothetical protein
LEGNRIHVSVHPIVYEALNSEEQDGLIELEKKIYKKILLKPDEALGVEKYEMFGDQSEAELK